MKKTLLAIATALSAIAVTQAQNISAVSESGETTIYQTFDEAITEAPAGSTIYLPGGGFTHNDNVTITKRLTIMGVSHRADTDNADGATTVTGRLRLENGSDGTTIIGIYLGGDIVIGGSGTYNHVVNNVTLRYVNINSVYVGHSKCSGLVINQSYLRSQSQFNSTNAKITNCVTHHIMQLNGGVIDHSIVYCSSYNSSGFHVNGLDAEQSNITNNILIDTFGPINNNGITTNNCVGSGEWGDNPVKMEEGQSWENIFVAHKGITPASDYHLSTSFGKNADTNGGEIGLYGGTGFNDAALAPIPRIVAKTIPEQTDASGKLKISVTVKSN